MKVNRVMFTRGREGQVTQKPTQQTLCTVVVLPTHATHISLSITRYDTLGRASRRDSTIHLRDDLVEGN